MANLLILLTLLIIFKLSSGRYLGGLYLSPEVLKTGGVMRRGNDYTDYNPDYILREIIVTIPILETNHIGIIEVNEKDACVEGCVPEQAEAETKLIAEIM